MAKTLGNVRIFGDSTSGVWVAPKGTTGPVGMAAPSVTFKELGWLSEDGIEESRSQDANSFKAWQGGATVRRKVSSTEDTFKFQCLEANAVTHGLKYRGQIPVTTTGVARTTVTNQSVIDDRAWVLDNVDGAITDRFVIPSGAYELTGSVSYKNDSIRILEFTVTVQGDYYHDTNDPTIAI